MQRRTPVIAVIVAVALSAVGLGPASAALDDPGVADLDASTPGHVTGTVTSVAPFVTVRIAADVAPQVVTMSEGTGTFDLETWGYTGPLPVLVASCEVEVPTVPEDCSTEIASAETFQPTDVVPDVTWPEDASVGPADEPTVTVSDPTGGGDLRVVWDNAGTDLETAVTRDEATPLNLSDGSGQLRLLRCRAGSTTVCTGFADEETVFALTVRTVLAATVGTVATLTTANPSSSVVVDTDATGTYTLAWSLEQEDTPLASGNASGDLDLAGATAPFAVTLGDLADGTYDLDVSITVTDPAVGLLPEVTAAGTVIVDTTGPAVTLSRSVGTIYPLIATTAYPTLTRIDVTGDPTPITGFVVRTAGGKLVRNLSLTVNKTVWNGRNNLGKVVDTGTYSIFAVDADGNTNATPTTVTVSRQTLVLKSFVKEVTASGSMFGSRYVGTCSTLKIPSARGTKGSLGFYSNTKCGTRTFAASAVSTAHTVTVPAAAKYLDMHVNVTGGSAVGYKGSKGILRYLKTSPGATSGHWVNETVMSSDYGIHRGPTQSLTGMLDANRFLVWGFLTSYGSRYDVIRFTVVVRYYALS